LNVSGIDLDDQIIAESGLNGRSHTGFADLLINFDPISTPAEAIFG
jgi:hypothetical protein